jgi:hypothetical protein
MVGGLTIRPTVFPGVRTEKGGPAVARRHGMDRSTAVRASEAHERPVVLLVEPSALRRAALSRALVAEGFDVRALETLGTARTVGLAIVNLEDLTEEDADALLAALLTHLDVPVILRSEHPRYAEAGARVLGINFAVSLAKGAPEREVVAHACRWCRSGSAGENEGRKSFERLIPAALERVPALAVEREDLGWYEADADQAVFLASIDGERNLEAIAACSGLSPSVVMSVARTLVEAGAVVLT